MSRLLEHPGMLSGLKIIESVSMVDGPFEDWSQVRSPGRARRRRRQGHQQRIRLYYKPREDFLRTADTIIGHPATIAKLKAVLHPQLSEQDNVG